MRQWQMVVALAVAACGKAEAETVRASFVVSVTVVDQCLVRPDIRAATCTGGAGYAVGVARERVSLPTGGQLTGIGEHAHISGGGPLIAISPSATGLAAIADRAIMSGSDQIDALRITYSF